MAGNNMMKQRSVSRVMNNNNNKSSPQFVWWTCCLVGALVVLALSLAPVDCQEQLTVESRQAKEQAASENELADTIKYLEKLEKLDKYWSEVARPRFGRSEYKQPSMMASRSELYSRQAPSMRLVKALSSGEPRVSSLVELINARLAQKYNSNEAY